MNIFWREDFPLEGTKLSRNTTYHPQTEGQLEVVIHLLKTYLRCFINRKPKQWANGFIRQNLVIILHII